MKLEDVKAGMLVRISMGYCHKTDHLCGTRFEMMKLRGSLATVRSVNINDGITMVDGWTWHPADLMDAFQSVPKTKKKKVEKVFFDEKLLWI